MRIAIVAVALLVALSGCGAAEDAAEQPAPAYTIVDKPDSGQGQGSIVAQVKRKGTTAELRAVFDAIRQDFSQEERGYYVAIDCETGGSKAAANRLANGRYAVGRLGAAQTGLDDGQAEFEVNAGSQCPLKSRDVADAYALKRSGGVRTGCSAAKPGADAARTPGCIYAAALAGCAAAREGEPDPSATAPRDGDFTEPALRAVMARAYRDC